MLKVWIEVRQIANAGCQSPFNLVWDDDLRRLEQRGVDAVRAQTA